MTVCIAALFKWNNGRWPDADDWGSAAIVASDRMLTSNDSQYEPQQQKIAMAGTKTIILVAGDISTHSQAIKKLHEKVPANSTAKPEDVAIMYGRELQAIRRRQAEDIFLSPLNLNTDSFLAQQQDMSEGFVRRITSQLQDFEGEDVDALVVGMDQRAAQLYSVNRHGFVDNCGDIGFAAIGIGSWHARSQFIQAGFVNAATAAHTFATVIAAKKAAEYAPGVGKRTDYNLIFRDEIRPLWPEMTDKLEELYATFDTGRQALINDALEKLKEFMDVPAKKAAEDAPSAGTAAHSGNQGSGSTSRAKDSPEGAE